MDALLSERSSIASVLVQRVTELNNQITADRQALMSYERDMEKLRCLRSYL